MFNCLHKANIKLKLTKWNFFKPHIHYLRHFLSQEGISLLPEKIDSVKSMPLFTVLRIHRLLQKSHQSLHQHHLYSNAPTKKTHAIQWDKIVSKSLHRVQKIFIKTTNTYPPRSLQSHQ